MIDIHDLMEKARLAVLEAGQAIMRVYVQHDLGIQIKADQSPLTTADEKSHTIITRRLTATGYPILSEESPQLDYATRKEWEYFWMIDPLDGTKEFISRNGEFTVNIALIHFHKPIAGVIYAPAMDILYMGGQDLPIQKIHSGHNISIAQANKRKTLYELRHEEKVNIAVSRSHLTSETTVFVGQFRNARLVSKGSSLKFMMLLEGTADLYPRFGPTMEWDTAAAHAILNAANRGVYTVDLQHELEYNKRDLVNPSFIAR